MTLRITSLVATASLAAAAALATPARAQSLVALDSARTTSAGPVLAAASVALRSAPPMTDTRALAAYQTTAREAGKFSDNGRYMIVGGVTFLAGAIIGNDVGTVMMVGGAALGIYGLYRYLEAPASEEMARRQETGARN